MDTLILSREDVAHVVRSVGLDAMMDEMLAALRTALRAFDERTEVQTRNGFIYAEPRPSLLEWMPAAQAGRDAVVKMVGYNPLNPLRRELPTIVSTLSLYDVTSGHLSALCDGTYLTALRTGAASALASEILAQPGSSIVGLIGAGAQAITQLHALSRIFDLETVYVYDSSRAAAETFADRVAFLNLDIRVASRATLEQQAQIICTATTVPVNAPPVLDATDLRSDVHINAVGSDMPGKTELPLSFLRRSFVTPDYLPQAVLEGECQRLDLEEIGPQLDLLLKEPAPYHQHRDRSTVFDSTGFALEDLAAMRLMLRLADDLNVGRRISIESMAYDAMNPYSFILDT